MPDIPTHRMVGPDYHIPERVERGPIFFQRTYGVHFGDLDKAMMLQMNRLKGVKIDQIQRAKHMANPGIRPGAGEDIIMRELMNNTIKKEMKQTQGRE